MAAAKQARQNAALVTGPALRDPAAGSLVCSRPDPLVGYEDPDLPLVSCDAYGHKFLTDRAFLTDEDIASAVAVPGRAIVDLALTDSASAVWTDFTTRNVGKEFAIVVKASIVLAARTTEPMGRGVIHLSGRFDEYDAQNMARQITRH